MKVSDIKLNPDNPRIIKDDKFKKLVKSVQDFPVMLEKRPLMLDENNVIIGGNMRFKAALEAKLTEIPVEHFTRKDADRNNKSTGLDKTYEEYVREFIIKDNVSGGDWDWDMMANEWDAELLDEWGLDLPGYDDKLNEDKEVDVAGIMDSTKTIVCPKCKFEFENEV